MDDDRLTTLQRRVADGITWLSEHDPTGAFHFWFESGLTPRSPMPVQDEARREEWAAWHKARQLWGALDRELLALDKRWRKGA